jgi:four helix bundle protein
MYVFIFLTSDKVKKMIKKLEDLQIWTDARELCDSIFIQTQKEPFLRDFGLKDQINRSSGSVMDNIAEGFGRNGNKEFVQFLSISKASCFEVKSQLYRAKDRGYLSEKEFETLITKIEELTNRCGGFIQYLKKSEFKGIKFK